jgi:type II secretion system protein N
MKFFRKKTLWYILYSIFITVLFLYLLFPGELVRSRLQGFFQSAGYAVKSSALRASFPLGLKLKDLSINPLARPGRFLQIRAIDVQYSLRSIIRKGTYFNLSGKAYDGSFSGNIGIPSLKKPYPPSEAELNFKNLDLLKFALIGNELGRQIAGKASGALNYSADSAGKITAGALRMNIAGGTYPLAQPFLGINKIDFKLGEIQAVFQNGGINLERLELSGGQINCLLTGNIIPADILTQSRLNLSGTMEIVGKDKVKMKVTIGGTLANPVFKYN